MAFQGVIDAKQRIIQKFVPGKLSYYSACYC